MTEHWLVAQMSSASLRVLEEDDDGIAVVWSRVETWNPRKSVVVKRRQRVLLDYVFIRPYDLPRIQSELEVCAHHVSPMRTAHGELLLVPAVAVDELLIRAEAGEFDQLHSRRNAPKCGEPPRATEQRRIDLEEGADVTLTVGALGVVSGIVVHSGSKVVLETRTALGRVSIRAESVEGVLVN